MVKLKKEKMKTTIFYLSALLISISSCTTTYNTYHYSDPNYLNSDEFVVSDPEEENIVIIEEYDEIEIVGEDTILYEEGSTVNNYYGDYYEDDSQYDFYYSSRIRRFHRPYYSNGYYGNYYTNSFWYTGNPYHCGTSIYYSNGWNSPYYGSSWGYYDPYYSFYNSYYYTPYYGGYYNNHNHHGNYYSWGNTNNSNSTDYVFGHRGSFSGKNRHVTVKSNVTNNTPHNTFIKTNNSSVVKTNVVKSNNTNNNVIKTNVVKSNNTNSNVVKTNRNVKTTTIKTSNRNNSSGGNKVKTNKTTIKTNKTNTNRNTTIKSNRSNNSNRTYKSSGNRSNNSGNNRNSGGGNRSVKPRK